jgi:MOSC domain-containing protein YiiM
MKTKVDQLLVGSVQAIPGHDVKSGIVKRPTTSRLMLRKDGFEADAQEDLKHHGGLEKAVHHYPFEHYETWSGLIGEQPVLNQPGAFGENISTKGMTEQSVAIGDRFRFGDALIEVSQGRQPCWKLNLRFGVSSMAKQVQKSGMTGWYYRVLEEGYCKAGQELELVERISPDWTLHRLWRTLYVDVLNEEELSGMAALEHLPDGWRRYAERRLQTMQVEDGSKRLSGE